MRPTILIVDDDGDVRAMLRTALVEDYEVIEAHSGLDGLKEHMKGMHKIDLVITDLKMPDLNGIELIENLIDEPPVIVISAYLPLPEFRDELSRIKPVATIEKPFRLETFYKAIERALSGSSS